MDKEVAAIRQRKDRHHINILPISVYKDRIEVIHLEFRKIASLEQNIFNDFTNLVNA